MPRSKAHATISEIKALFPPDTAGNLMITNIPIVLDTSSIKDVKDYLLGHAASFESLNYVYVVNKRNELVGVVSIRELFQTRRRGLKSVLTKNPITVNPLVTSTKVTFFALKHKLKMVPVVDHEHRLIGAVSSDILLETMNDEFREDLLKLSGIKVPRKHFPFNSIKIVTSRFPWIFIGMFGGLLTGVIINVFKASIESVVALAIFIPVIMSTGATMSNQSAMVFIRNLVYGDIENKWKYLKNECVISFVLGIGASVIAFLIISLFTLNMALAFVVASSLFFTIVSAAIVGTMTPLVLSKYHFDPSLGAGPFLTIIKDLVAMTVYFSIATLLLRFVG